MPFKLKSLNNNPWAQSTAIHLFFGLVLTVILIRPKLPMSTKVDMEIFEAPTLAPKTAVKKIATPRVVPKPQKRAVFGTSRKTITVPSEEGLTTKTGNTLAKTPDSKVLDKDDPDALPIPVDEFAVTQMPVVKNEFRIPYPAEAKHASIQGAVVMDLLIDTAGKVRDVQLIRGPGHGLNEAALNAVRNFEFLPAQVGERAVAVRIRYAYRFILER